MKPSQQANSWNNLKAETESEGASFEKIAHLNEQAGQLGLPLYVKIGGVEAKTDLSVISNIGVRGVIAPMVESPFGVEKFALAIAKHDFSWSTLTIETMTAHRQIEQILEAAHFYGIDGITVGRGDLAASMGLKGDENSDEVMRTTEEIVYQAKELGFWTTVGGKMNAHSLEKLTKRKMPFDAIETRRVAIKYESSTQDLITSLEKAINFEIQIEKTHLGLLERDLGTIQSRVDELSSRISET